jgi:hypothetical protein
MKDLMWPRGLVEAGCCMITVSDPANTWTGLKVAQKRIASVVIGDEPVATG